MKTPCAKKKFQKVMSEFKGHKLKSSSGKPVTKRKQAVAIAVSEANRASKKCTCKK